MKISSLIAGSLSASLLLVLSVALAVETPAVSTPAPTAAGAANRIEQRIKSLHDQLKITTAEEAQWAPVAQAMRDSAQKVGVLIRERHQEAGKMNAVDDLRSYQAIAEAHAAGVRKLVSTFEPLYAGMSPEQQRNADAIFAKTIRRQPAQKKTN